MLVRPLVHYIPLNFGHKTHVSPYKTTYPCYLLIISKSELDSIAAVDFSTRTNKKTTSTRTRDIFMDFIVRTSKLKLQVWQKSCSGYTYDYCLFVFLLYILVSQLFAYCSCLFAWYFCWGRDKYLFNDRNNCFLVIN